MLETMIEKTLVIIKPDGVQNNLIPEISRRFDAEKLSKKFYRKYVLEEQKVEQLYSHLKSKIPQKNFDSIIKYMTSSEVVVVVYEGEDAVAKVRRICGPTDPLEARQNYPSSIRALSKDSLEDAKANGSAVQNIIHSSGSAEEAEREMKLLGISLQ